MVLSLIGSLLVRTPASALAGLRLQLFKDREHLARQRADVHDLPLHLGGRDSPFGGFEIDLVPFGVAELASTDIEYGCQPHRELGDEANVEKLDVSQ